MDSCSLFRVDAFNRGRCAASVTQVAPDAVGDPGFILRRLLHLTGPEVHLVRRSIPEALVRPARVVETRTKEQKGTLPSI